MAITLGPGVENGQVPRALVPGGDVAGFGRSAMRAGPVEGVVTL